MLEAASRQVTNTRSDLAPGAAVRRRCASTAPSSQVQGSFCVVTRPGPPCCGAQLSVHVVTMTFMSEPPASDTHDVIHPGGAVVAVVVPIAKYQQLRQAAEEQWVNEEFDAARTEYLARRDAGTIRYVSHEEAGRLGMSSPGPAHFLRLGDSRGNGVDQVCRPRGDRALGDV
jgi:hypothetical protein